MCGEDFAYYCWLCRHPSAKNVDWVMDRWIAHKTMMRVSQSVWRAGPEFRGWPAEEKKSNGHAAS